MCKQRATNMIESF